MAVEKDCLFAIPITFSPPKSASDSRTIARHQSTVAVSIAWVAAWASAATSRGVSVTSRTPK